MAAPALPASLRWAKPLEAVQHRICQTKYATSEPGFWAGVSGRFDDPMGIFETLYCASTFDVCYAETLLRERFEPSSGQFEVPRLEHDSKSLSLLLVDFSKLKIVDLFNEGPAMGLNHKHVMGDYDDTRELARAMYDHRDEPHGLIYLSRFATGRQPSIVLFDRAKPHVRVLPGFKPAPLWTIPEVFTTLTQVQKIALV